LLILLGAALLFLPFASLAAQQNVSVPQKFALVIGNGAYTSVTRLNNPVNDANDMRAALQGLGFTVDAVINGNLMQMEEAVIRLKNRLSVSKNAYGFFFYAGHGVQSGGENYLVPVDAVIPSENYLRQRAVSVQTTLDELNDAGNELNVVVLDACRDNPFSWKRSGSRGLQVVGNQPADSIIVYATSAGSTAADGAGRNGLFTGYLLNNLKTPGLEVREVFRRTHADVRTASNNEQRPAVYDQFGGLAYLSGQPVAQTVQPPVQPAPAPAAQPPAPDGFVRINGGTFTMGSPANEANRESDEGPQHQVTVSGFYMGKYEVTVGEFRQFVNASGYKTQSESRGGHVLIESKWESKTDANWKNPYLNQNDSHPVVLVSWNDAVEYCNWRSRSEGLTPVYTVNGANVTWNRSAQAGTAGYRLPTEAEWEYACRAGTSTPYNSGNSADNAAWYIKNSGRITHPVGSKQQNAWGLYDMHGNVWEWCWDWYGSYPSGAQTDPVGASSGTTRVRRGGGWSDTVLELRSAKRYIGVPLLGGNFLGFRLVRQ
jgi:formylglycine-generating enzyme required for sulfatase activity